MLKRIYVSIFLFITVVFLNFNLTFAKCGAETRETIDFLKCDDLAANSWYQLEVNKMCGTYSGVEGPMIEVVEKRPGFTAQRAAIFLNQIPKLIYRYRNLGEFELFRQRAGNHGSIEAFAVISANTISQIKLRIKTNDGREYLKSVDVANVWNMRW